MFAKIVVIIFISFIVKYYSCYSYKLCKITNKTVSDVLVLSSDQGSVVDTSVSTLIARLSQERFVDSTLGQMTRSICEHVLELVRLRHQQTDVLKYFVSVERNYLNITLSCHLAVGTFCMKSKIL